MSDLAVNLNLSSLIACHECDLLHPIKKLNPGEVAKCSRCCATFYKEKKNSITRTLSLAIDTTQNQVRSYILKGKALRFISDKWSNLLRSVYNTE